MNVTANFGHWVPDIPGSGLMRQSFAIRVAGRATRLLPRVAAALADGLEWGRLNDTVFPWGMPFGARAPNIDPDQHKHMPVGSIIVRAALGGGNAVYGQGAGRGPNQAAVGLDVLMYVGSDPAFLDEAYDRMEQIEEAVEAMAGTRIAAGGQ